MVAVLVTAFAVLAFGQPSSHSIEIPGSDGGHGAEQSAPARPLVSTTPPTGTPPSVAFVDDRDQIVQLPPPVVIPFRALKPAVASPLPDATPPPFADPTATHEGEVSISGTLATAFISTFISTRDDASGDVYVERVTDPSPVRITCDGFTQTHPVVSPDGTQVAYATDAGGSYQIAVAELNNPPCAGGTETFLQGQGGQPLADVDRRDDPGLQQHPGQPARRYLRAGHRCVVGGHAADGRRRRSRELRAVPSQGSCAGRPVCVVVGDHSIPSRRLGRRDHPPSTGDAALPRTVSSPWDGSAPQGSEPTVSSDGQLAFTSTLTNPLGSVVSVRPSSPLQFSVTSINDPVDASAPTSHPAWLPTDTGPTLVFTARAVAADVDAVTAADGSGRGVLTDTEDSATPGYSPDGQRIAFSQASGQGRQLLIANADGSGTATPVQDGWLDNAAASPDGVTDFDIQPAWSRGGKNSPSSAPYTATPGARR